ncbi:MAG TPA: hypothetical protein VIR29_06485 [Anseongella sp.]
MPWGSYRLEKKISPQQRVILDPGAGRNQPRNGINGIAVAAYFTIAAIISPLEGTYIIVSSLVTGFSCVPNGMMMP